MDNNDNDDLRSRVPDTVPGDVELFERDGEVYGRDEHGEFKLDPMRGSSEPRDDRCGVPVKYYEERYGQIRYCTGLPEKRFVYGGSEFCKHHKSRQALMDWHQELFKHGYFVVNYANFVKRLDAVKFLFAVEMVGGLFEMSQHDFDIANVTKTLDTSDTDLIHEDAIEVDFPIPQRNDLSFQANELWMAALDEVKVQNMQEAVFSSGMSQQTLADSADMEGQITDERYEETEHHLHLPISRLTKDIKEHLQNGGVDVDADDGGVVTFQKNDYTLDVSPDESAQDDTESLSEVSSEFSEQLSADSDAAEIAVDE